MSKRYPGGIIRKTPPTTSQTSAQGIWDMASVTQAVKENTWPIAGVPDPISKSLRFRSSASAYLNRTPASAGNRQKWTWSAWVKFGTISASNGTLFNAGTTSGEGTRFYLRYTSDILQTGYGSFNYFSTTNVLRDPSSWYHIVLAYDSTQSTASNRILLYINGTLATYTFGTNVTLNVSGAVNNNVSHQIGSDQIIPGGYFDGYMAEVYFVDGQQLTPSSFGNTNDQTGVWQPIAYTGTYGTNGFYLPFSNTASTATLGYDFSGNSNNWTTNNISLTSGSTYDSMVDVPTQWIPYNTAGDTGALFRGNYCTLNPLDNGGNTVSNGNLVVTTAVGFDLIRSTMFVSSGKWYWEITCDDCGEGFVGISSAAEPLNQRGGETANSAVIRTTNGDLRTNAVNSAYGSAVADGNIMMFALDMDSGKFWAGKSGTWFNSGDPAAGTNAGKTGLTVAVSPSISVYDNEDYTANFGQRPFTYTPPAGFKTLCTTNLSTPTIGTTPTTQANDYFNAVLYTGTSGTQAVTGVGFQPDWVWIKGRNSAGVVHVLQDAVRGTTAYLVSNTTQAENTNTANNWFRSFDSNGFTVATLTSPGGVSTSEWNNTGYTYVSWNWNAGGSNATNTAGTITSTVRANTTAGFSIVTFTAPSGSTAYTVGHGLGTTPAMIIVKERGAAGNDWYVWHQSYSNTAQGNQRLNTTAAVGNSSQVWNNTAPTSTVFSSIAGTAVASSTTAVAYCFAQVAGYSAFGSYTGNGSSDGPFVFTGFRPAFVLTKRTDSTGNWYLWDNKRIISANGDAGLLYPDSSLAESDYNAAGIDLLSNGFKIRNSDASDNGSGGTFIYMAFAESPFKFALAR